MPHPEFFGGRVTHRQSIAFSLKGALPCRLLLAREALHGERKGRSPATGLAPCSLVPETDLGSWLVTCNGRSFQLFVQSPFKGI